MNCRQFAEVHSVHPRQAQLRWPRFQSHKSNLDPGNPWMHSSKSAWLPDTLSSREYLQEKCLWMSLAKHGCTSCTMFSHKLSYVNKRQAIEGSSRMRSKGSHFRGSLGVEGVFARRCATVRNRAAPVFFSGPPRPLRIRSLAIAARSSTEILMDTAMLIDLPDLTTMRSPDVISCHGYRDLLSWFSYVVMQHSSLKELRIESM